MPKLLVKQFILVALIILAILSIIFGSYLALVKSQSFIVALGSIPSIRTTEQFKTNFDKAFKFYSPIGDEEVAKFLVNNVLQFVSQQNQQEAVARMLVGYVEPYMFKNDVRHLLASAQMYQILWERYGHQEDFQTAENYFKSAYAIGPKLPPVLYGLLDFYGAKRDAQKVKEIGGIILGYWPDDTQVQNIVKSLK